MKKKLYEKPQMTAIEIQTEGLICESLKTPDTGNSPASIMNSNWGEEEL